MKEFQEGNLKLSRLAEGYTLFGEAANDAVFEIRRMA